MAKIDRFNGNLEAFASASVGAERTIFGDIIQSDTLDDNVNADYLRGWGIVPPTAPPSKQDFNALGFTSTLLLAYLHQMGVAEWNATQEYYEGSVAVELPEIYISKINANIGNQPSANPLLWKRVATTEETTPAGAVMHFAQQLPPTGWLVCDGSPQLNAAYPLLFAAIGNTYGMPGPGQFSLPDLRGKFIRGFDDGAGNDPEAPPRAFGSDQGYATEEHSHWSGISGHELNTREAYAGAGYTASNVLNKAYNAASVTNATDRWSAITSGIVSSAEVITAPKFGATASATPGGPETRPINVALLPCIKY